MRIYLAINEQTEIVGSRSEYQQIRKCIQALLDSSDEAFTIPALPTDKITPWDKSLSVLAIRKEEGKINVYATDDELIIAGSSEHFEALSSYFDFDDDEKYPVHHHLEYRPGHHILKARALNLVIGLDNPEDVAKSI